MIMLDAINIMWLRQMKRFVRSRARLVGSLAQPLLFLVTFGFGFSSVYSKAGNGNFIDYLAPGIIVMTIVFGSIFSGIDVMWDKQFGFLKETLVAPVPRWALMAGRTLGAATVAVVQGVLVLLVTLGLGFRPDSWWMLGPALIVMALIAIIFTAFGTAVGARLSDMQGFQLIMNFIVMPLVFLSGALFPLTGLPPVMYAVVRLNPLSYGVDALRHILIDAGSFGLATDFAVLLVFTTALVAIGTYLFSKIEV